MYKTYKSIKNIKCPVDDMKIYRAQLLTKNLIFNMNEDLVVDATIFNM